MKHTPKPWKTNWDRYGKSSEIFGGEGEICEPVCIIPHDDITSKGEKEMKANASLIEAAPDLLECCLEHLKDYEAEYAGLLIPPAMQRKIERLMSAILKAGIKPKDLPSRDSDNA